MALFSIFLALFNFTFKVHVLSRELNCERHQMPNWLFHRCDNCHIIDKFCEICIHRGPPVCLQCKPGFYPFRGYCRGNECFGRINGCELCDVHEEEIIRCKKCKPGFNLQNHQCLSCSAWENHCIDCFQTPDYVFTCLKCDIGYTLMNGSCIFSSNIISNCSLLGEDVNKHIICDTCSPGFLYDNKTNVCLRCEEVTRVKGCSKCLIQTINTEENFTDYRCVECQNEFKLSINSTVCEPCLPNCRNCTSEGLCLKCEPNYFLEIPGLSSCSKCENSNVSMKLIEVDGDFCYKFPSIVNQESLQVGFDNEYFIVKNVCTIEPDVKAYYSVTPFSTVNINTIISYLQNNEEYSNKLSGEIFGTSYIDNNGDMVIKNLMPYGKSYLNLFCVRSQKVASSGLLVPIEYKPETNYDIIIVFSFNGYLDKQSLINLLCMLVNIFKVNDDKVTLNGTKDYYCRGLTDEEKDLFIPEPYIIRIQKSKIPNMEEAFVDGFKDKLMEFKILLRDYSKIYRFLFFEELLAVRAFLDHPELTLCNLEVNMSKPKIKYLAKDQYNIEFTLSINKPGFFKIAIQNKESIYKYGYEELESTNTSRFFFYKIIYSNENEHNLITIPNLNGLEDKNFTIYVGAKYLINECRSKILFHELKYKFEPFADDSPWISLRRLDTGKSSASVVRATFFPCLAVLIIVLFL